MNQMSKLTLTRPRDFGDLITDSFGYVRTHYRSLGKAVLYFVVPIIAVSSLFFGQYMQQIASIQADPDSLDSISAMFTSLGGSGIFGMLASAAMSVVVFNHMALVAESDGNNVTVHQIWERFKSDIWAIIAISILTFIFTFLGMIAFFIPGLYLAIKFTLIPAAYIKERIGISDAFSRSWHLTTNFWWFTLGLIIVMGLLVSFMSYFLAIPIMLTSMFVEFAGGQAGIDTVITIIYATAVLLGYLFYALLYISIGLHYFNLVERKEGSTMKQRIDQIQ